MGEKEGHANSGRRGVRRIWKEREIERERDIEREGHRERGT